ncbi:MAG: hypothetical protein GX362_00965 [Methanosarcinaceae archaeon]|nr:hypothetical protein [Methanosarcinaceae archaeon]
MNSYINLFIQGTLVWFLAPFTFLTVIYKLDKFESIKLKKVKKDILTVLKFTLIIVVLTVLIFIIIKYISKDNYSPGYLEQIAYSDPLNFVLGLIALFWVLAGAVAVKLTVFILTYKDTKYSDLNKNRYWISWGISAAVFALLNLQYFNYNLINCILLIGIPTIIYGFLWKVENKPELLWAVNLLHDFILVFLIKFLV